MRCISNILSMFFVLLDVDCSVSQPGEHGLITGEILRVLQELLQKFQIYIRKSDVWLNFTIFVQSFIRDFAITWMT